MLQIAILLTVGALILAAILPGGSDGGKAAKTRITLERMEKIEEATQDYMSKNHRRPYPADITAGFDSASYGIEIDPPNSYSSVPTTHFTSTCVSLQFATSANDRTLSSGYTTPFHKNWLVSGDGIPEYTWLEGITSGSAMEMSKNATAAGTQQLYFRNPLVAGGVPVKTLGLPDEYAVDGFGRRMVYMVDSRATVEPSCTEMQNRRERGALQLSNSEDFDTGTFDQAMWALLSLGQDGQGAVGIQGSALSKRIKTGNTDASTLVNAFYDATQTTSFINLGLVKKPETSTFDDIVWVNEKTKNTCAMGNVNSTRDFRINGGGSGDAVTSATFGDVNGDTFPDLITGTNGGSVRVIFGKKDNWPEPNTAFDTTTLDGNNGFTIAAGSFTQGIGYFVRSGDLNGDGYDDIITGADNGTSSGYVVIFGGANWPATYTIGTSTIPSSPITITGLSGTAASYLSVDDVNGDGYDDIALPFDINGANGPSDWAVGVIYGQASAWANITANTSFFDGTKGVYFRVASPGASTGAVSFGPSTASLPRQMTAICNVNGDGYKDLIIPGAAINTGNTTNTPVIESSATNTTGDSTASITVTKPSGTVEGDLLVAIISKVQSNADDVALPTGWVKHGTNVSTIRQVFAYKKAGASEPANYTFTPTATSNMSVSILRISGATVANGVNIATSYNSGGTATTFTAPSITTTVANTLVLYTLSTDSNQALTGTPGSSTVVTNIASTGTYANRQSIYTKAQASAGATGTGVYTVAAPASGAGYSIAIKLAPVQRAYLKLGQNSWEHSSGLIDPSASPMLSFNTSTDVPPEYDMKALACKDINSDGYDDVLIYMVSGTTENIYTYFGRSSPATTNMDADYDIRFALTTGAPAWKDAASIPQVGFADVNNDGRQDIVLSRVADDPNVSISGTTFTINTGTGGTTRSNAGTAYVLYQPSTCTISTASSCWGTTPNLAKDFFGDYDYDGTDGIAFAGAVASDGITFEATADMNKDNKNDLIFRSTVSPNGGYFVFGKTDWPGNYDFNCTRNKSGAHCPDQITAK